MTQHHKVAVTKETIIVFDGDKCNEKCMMRRHDMCDRYNTILPMTIEAGAVWWHVNNVFWRCDECLKEFPTK